MSWHIYMHASSAFGLVQALVVLEIMHVMSLSAFFTYLMHFAGQAKEKAAAICGCADLHLDIVPRVAGCREAHHAFALQIVQERHVL